MQALLLAQDPDESAILSLALQRAGLIVSRSVNLDATLSALSTQPIDFILIAVEDTRSLERIRHLREQTTVPLVIIVDSMTEGAHIALLDAGADLAITRPFSTRLLISQLRVLARRATGLPIFTLPTLSVEDLTLDPSTRSVQIGNATPKRLTHLEFRLLYTLMIHREQTVPTDSLVEHVWGYAGDGDRELVRGLVSRLRAKIEPNPRCPHYVVTVPGVGYALLYTP